MSWYTFLWSSRRCSTPWGALLRLSLVPLVVTDSIQSKSIRFLRDSFALASACMFSDSVSDLFILGENQKNKCINTSRNQSCKTERMKENPVIFRSLRSSTALAPASVSTPSLSLSDRQESYGKIMKNHQNLGIVIERSASSTLALKVRHGSKNPPFFRKSVHLCESMCRETSKKKRPEACHWSHEASLKLFF